MEDDRALTDEIAESLDRTQNAGGRPGGGARGGVKPAPDDPVDPRRAEALAEPLNRQMRASGFGDHKGEDMGRDGTGQRG